MNLILTVCLVASMGECQDITPVIEPMSPMACMIQGQQIAAEWVGEHPKWMLSTWRCGAGKRVKVIDL